MPVSFDEYPKNFFETNILLLKLGGMWYPEENLPGYKRFALFSFNFAMILCNQIIYTPLEIACLDKTYKNLNLLIEHVGVILSHLLGTFKLAAWYYNRKSILSVMDLLHDDDYKYESHGDYRPSEIFESNRKISSTLSIVFIVLAQGFPLWKCLDSIDIFKFDDETIKNTTCFPHLPYFSWVPFDTDTTKRCAMAMFFQIVPVWLYAWQVVAHDMLFASILNCIKAHFVILQGAFTTIRPRCLKRLGINEKDIFDDADYPALEKEMYAEIRKSTIHLQKLIELRTTFENAFTYATLAQVLVTLFVTVTCLFMVSTLPLFSGESNAQIEYFITIMVQFSLYAWFANEITLSFSGLLNGLWNGDWLSSSGRFKKCMIINMMRVQRPYIITVGKFGPLTLNTFVSILRGSYSYYAVLMKKNRR